MLEKSVSGMILELDTDVKLEVTPLSQSQASVSSPNIPMKSMFSIFYPVALFKDRFISDNCFHFTHKNVKPVIVIENP